MCLLINTLEINHKEKEKKLTYCSINSIICNVNKDNFAMFQLAAVQIVNLQQNTGKILLVNRRKNIDIIQKRRIVSTDASHTLRFTDKSSLRARFNKSTGQTKWTGVCCLHSQCHHGLPYAMFRRPGRSYPSCNQDSEQEKNNRVTSKNA